MSYLPLTSQQTELHKTALRLSREHRELEARLCECLREIDQAKLFKKLGWSSLFLYATRELGLTEAIAYAFISVARKSREVPELKAAIEEKALSVGKASRLVSGLKPENAAELIAFAKAHSTREIESELARRNPARRMRDRVRPVSAESVEIRAQLSKSVALKLERAMALLAQKGKPTDFATVLESALDEYLKHHDPVEKAKRAEKRVSLRTGRACAESPDNGKPQDLSQDNNLSGETKATPERNLLRTRRAFGKNTEPRKTSPLAGQALHQTPALPSTQTTTQPTARAPSQPTPSSRRRPLSALEKHAVFLRDQGRCTFMNERGERCNADRWLHIHHIKAVSQGGTNDDFNLVTLCSAHHALAHQLSFPLEGQISWLRAPAVAYVA